MYIIHIIDETCNDICHWFPNTCTNSVNILILEKLALTYGKWIITNVKGKEKLAA
jgi:hypothetical protein